jgi:hypothetical protein
MTIDILVPTLAGLTFAAVLIWAFVSKRQTDEIKDDPDASKSSLAKDG